VPFSLPRALANCLVALPSRLPLRVAYCWHPAMQQQVHQLLHKEHFDLVYVKRTRMGQFVQHQQSLPRILDLTDAESLYYQRSLKTIDWWRFPLHLEEFLKLRRYEANIIRNFDRAVVCSHLDCGYLERQSHSPLAGLRVIPNVVDVQYYQSRVTLSALEQPVLLFSGLMDKHVNIDAAHYLVREIFPRIQRVLSQVTLSIVGPHPSPSVQALGRTTGVLVTGYVKDIRQYIEQATVILCPVRVGAGTRNKILQGWAMGRPVIATPLGAEGLEYRNGVELLSASSAEEFAAQTLRVVQDRVLQATLAANGRRLVVAKYSLESMAARFAELFHEMGCARCR